MPVVFRNYRAEILNVLTVLGLGLVPDEVVIGSAVGGLAQVSGLGNAADVLTSQGPGQPPHWAPGGGGGGGGTRMPWDVLGGWVGSVCDPGFVLNGTTGFVVTPTAGQIYAIAIVAGEATAFTKVRMIAASAQTGSGTQVVVTDDTGAQLAAATNADAVFTGIANTPQWAVLNLSATVTPAAGQVLYVMYLFPFSTVSITPGLWSATELPNWAAFPNTQAQVAFPSGAASFAANLNTIPNPQAPSGLTIDTQTVVWAALVP